MASRTIIVSSLVGGGFLLAVMGLQVEVISAANSVQGQEVQHEEDLDPTAQEILDLAKDMDFQSMRVRARAFEPMLDDILKPGQKPMAIALGKALFWDSQLGRDGQACASCHFHAGADSRRRGQLNGGRGNDGKPGSIDSTRSGGAGDATYALQSGDFPFHVLKDPQKNPSDVLFDTNDVVGSQGIVSAGPNPGRGTTGRNAPTVINAGFQFRTFWDGRANNHFNGVSPFGRRETADPLSQPDSHEDKTAKLRHQLMRVVTEAGNRPGSSKSYVRPVSLDLRNAALASQALGPPIDAVEMGGETWLDLGRKMLTKVPRPLYRQRVAPNDSVLGPWRHASHGLRVSYRELIQRTFRDHWWRDPRDPRTLKQGELPLIEHNFSLFFGIAVMLYEATLVSDQSPFDEHIASLKGKPGAKPLSGEAALGFSVFMTGGKCVDCHRGPELSVSGFESQLAGKNHREQVELMRMRGPGGEPTSMYDSGFYNLGVRPSNEDVGVGGEDHFGYPLSLTRQYLPHVRTGQGMVDEFTVDPCGFAIQPCEPIERPELVGMAVKGAFKTPSLRNVELTGPYMHNGGMATLRQVVEFYNRGGDFPNNEQSPEIKPLWLNDVQVRSLVAFLNSLTDERVRCEQAPFDHPALTIPDGYRQEANGTYREIRRELPAVGRSGRPKAACLKSFEDELRLDAGKRGNS